MQTSQTGHEGIQLPALTMELTASSDSFLRQTWSLVALAMLSAGCSLDTSPLMASEGTIVEDIESAPAVAGTSGADRSGGVDGSPSTGAEAGTGASSSAEPGDEAPAGSVGADAPTVDAAVSTADAATDTGVANSVPDAAQEVDLDAGLPQDEGSLLESLGNLIALDPRVREADALRRLRDAISSSPPDVSEALDALDGVNCRQNSRTCVSTCVWAQSNCRYCETDALCVDRLRARCGLTCP